MDYVRAGLQEPLLDAVEGGGCINHINLNDGTQVLDINTADSLEVDMESAHLILELELDRLIEEFHDNPNISRTAGYRYYMHLGAISPAKGQHRVIDDILRRSAYYERNGLAGQIDYRKILDKTVETIDEDTHQFTLAL